MSEWISTAALAKASGLTFRQIDYWMRCGYVPVGRSGSGRQHAWPPSAVEFFRVIRQRLDAGMAVGPALFEVEPPTIPSLPCRTDEIVPSGTRSFANDAKRLSDEELAAVAAVYQADDTGEPVNFVAATLRIPHSTASGRIGIARRRGFLPPYKRGVA